MSWLRRRWLWILVGLVVLGSSYKGYTLIVGPTAPATIVARRELVQRVVASGRVLPPARITPRQHARPTVVERVLVEEGSTCKAGQLLLQLEDAVEQASVAQARAGVAQAEAQAARSCGASARAWRTRALRQAERHAAAGRAKHRRVQARSPTRGDRARSSSTRRRRRSTSPGASSRPRRIRRRAPAALGSEHQFVLSSLAQARADGRRRRGEARPDPDRSPPAAWSCSRGTSSRATSCSPGGCCSSWRATARRS